MPLAVASGRAHDLATWLLALPFGLLWWPWMGLAGSGWAALGFLVGGLYLSPDLDTRSRPYQRWGPLRLLWWPYRRLLPHRSVVSHAPLLGTAGRLLYSLGVVLGLSGLLSGLGGPTPLQCLQGFWSLWQRHQGLTLAALAGVEASTWLHLIQDGDPMPRLRRRSR